MQLVILCGGRSAEHEISFLSAASVLNQIDLERYVVSVIGIGKDGAMLGRERVVSALGIDDPERFHFPDGTNWLCLLAEMEPRPEIVFPLLHGPFGEDGTVQGALELLDLPYVGAGVWGSAVAMDKIHCKRLLLHSGLPVLPFEAFNCQEWERARASLLPRITETLRFPLFVKPSNLGSSVGINKSRNPKELELHIEEAFQYDDLVLVEQGIDAREIEISVLGNLEPRVSVPGEIIPSREFYSYEAKYLDDASRLLIPAPLEERHTREVQQLALRAYRALQLEGMARVDCLMERESGKFWINEPNTIPGFTRISMYPKLWEASGISYPDLIEELIRLGMERHSRRSRFSADWRGSVNSPAKG